MPWTGTIGAATIVGETASITRFRSRAAYAAQRHGAPQRGWTEAIQGAGQLAIIGVNHERRGPTPESKPYTRTDLCKNGSHLAGQPASNKAGKKTAYGRSGRPGARVTADTSIADLSTPQVSPVCQDINPKTPTLNSSRRP